MEFIKDTRSAVQIGLLAIVAGISAIIMLRTTGSESEDITRNELELAFFIKSAEVRGTAPDGTTIYRIFADHAQQDPDEEDISMENVALSYEPVAETPWDMFADTGRIPPDGKLVVLEGNVKILSKDPDSSQISITTTRINVLPDERKAYTDRKVTITRNGQKVRGTGMEANLNTSVIKLLSNVNGKYAPAP